MNAPCSCGTEARRLLAATKVDVDATPTPPLTGDHPAVIGTCERGVTWPAKRPRQAANAPAEGAR
jgi:hypothetical protein